MLDYHVFSALRNADNRIHCPSKLSDKMTKTFDMLLSLLLTGSVLLSQSSTEAEEHKYMGTATCASSNCHGAAAPRKGSNVLHNEYTTWSKKDAHSKAWRVLTNEDSKKISHNLGLGDPSKEPLCLKCHSTFIGEKVRGDKYTVEDGVSCESCHGASEDWLKSHTSSSSSHEDNLEDGMKNLVPVKARAELCLSCHQGNDDKFVNHRMIGAGHPRLSFELDTYSMIQPRHWDYDADYQERKGKYEPVRAWLVGQIKVAEGAINVMASEKRARNGIWPELSLFNCYACHHSLTQKQWRTREYKNGPGELRLNLSSLLLIHDAFTTLAPDIAVKLESSLSRLHDLYKKGEASDLLKDISKILSKDALGVAESIPLDSKTRLALLRNVSQFAATTPHPQYEEAEQLAMGISAILSTDPEKEKSLKSQVKKLYTALKSPEEFVAEAFTEAAKELAEAI